MNTLRTNNNEYLQELKSIEEDAIIEHLQSELERLEKRHKLLVMQEEKMLRQIKKYESGKLLLDRYNITWIEACLFQRQPTKPAQPENLLLQC